MTDWLRRFFFLMFCCCVWISNFAQDTVTTLSVLYPNPPKDENPYEIIADLNRRLDEDINNTQLLASRAIQYSNVNDYEYAFRDMKQAIELDPVDHSLYYNSGLI